MSAQLAELLAVLEARYRRDAAALARAKADEKGVAQALAAMEAQARSALATPGIAHHTVGATPLWQEQSRRRRATLLQELALARARVGEAETRLRDSLRRREGAAALLEDVRRMRSRAAARRQAEDAIARLILSDPP